MKRLTTIILLVATISCNCQNRKSKDKIGLIKKYDYSISIDIWNVFYEYQSKFILNNIDIDNYLKSNKTEFPNPLTLYHISKRNNISDTTQILFSKQKSDTLFNLTNAFFKTFSFNNYDMTINNVVNKSFVTDDSYAIIELSYGGRILNATISSINNPTIATREFCKLKQFVDNFISSDKR